MNFAPGDITKPRFHRAHHARVKTPPLALDAPGSAGAPTLRRSFLVTAVILVLALIIVSGGRYPLPPYPRFTIIHASFVFVIDLVTAFLLYGQFFYSRALSYAVLAAAFLFSALVTVPFMLSFPGALTTGDPIIGGTQSAIWVWHLWHIGFPAFLATSVLIHRRPWKLRHRAAAVVAITAGLAVLAVVAVWIVVTVFHDRLPVLYGASGAPLTRAFYTLGGFTALVTAASLLLTLQAARQRSLLHIWMAMVLLALLLDVTVSLNAYARYTVGWYFGRITAMLASSMLLMVLLADINRLYRRLAETARELSLAAQEKDQLLEEVHRREQDFETLAERASDIIARIDRTGRVRYISSAVARLTGMPLETFIGKSVTELPLPHDEKLLREEAIRRAFETGREQVLEHEHTVEGKRHYFHARITPEFGTSGAIESFLIIDRDITELKQAQLALERLTLQDPLTGIANRRYLEQFVDREYRIEVRRGHNIGVIMADIDYFKAYNDYYGHQRGDDCLRCVAQALQAHVHRPGDLLVRYGGEEFAVILLDSDLAAAAYVAEAMCREVRDRALPHAASPVAPVVTISIGVSAAPAQSMAFAKLLSLADQALYRAKAKGRNRVETSSSP